MDVMLGTQAVRSQGSLASQSRQSASSRFNERLCLEKCDVAGEMAK